MPQYNRRTVAFATVLRIFAAGKPPAARRAEKRPGRPYLISYDMLLYVTEYYGSVTKPQNPLTKKNRRGKVASQEKEEPPADPAQIRERLATVCVLDDAESPSCS